LKLNEVEIGKNVSDLSVRVVSVAPPRIVRARGGRKTQLTEVLVADHTGTTILSLWGFGQGSGLSAGLVIKITDGWAKEWQGKMQLSLGHSGRFEIMEDDESLPTISELRKRVPTEEISE
jgi:ssDNA-binding replication factor A large subunit